jgi:hypothetical protein
MHGHEVEIVPCLHDLSLSDAQAGHARELNIAATAIHILPSSDW